MTVADWAFAAALVVTLAFTVPNMIGTHKAQRRRWCTMADSWRTMAATARLQGRTESAVKYERWAAECDHQVRHWWTA